MPTIHLTNFSSTGLHRGCVFSIMAKPREWELGAGRVWALVPGISDLNDLKKKNLSFEEYENGFLAALEQRAGGLVPGALLATTNGREILVQDGDTLCCACSKEDAKRGRCHRAWAAPALRRAGWEVVLDGEPFGVVPVGGQLSLFS